jgi:molybdopterin synthase sulfur carrier subunit
MTEILVFGQLQDITGTHTLKLEGVTDTATLRERLFLLHPALRDARFAIAVDKHIVTGDAPIGPEAGVALLPPFSGG